MEKEYKMSAAKAEELQKELLLLIYYSFLKAKKLQQLCLLQTLMMNHYMY